MNKYIVSNASDRTSERSDENDCIKIDTIGCIKIELVVVGIRSWKVLDTVISKPGYAV